MLPQSLRNKVVLSLFSLVCGFIFVLGTTTPAHAQVETPDYTVGDQTQGVSPEDLLISEKIPGINEQVGVDIQPENPKPGDSVTISLDLYDTDINTKLIFWKVNGKEVARGIGQKKFTFSVGSAGSVTQVTATIILKSGKPLEQSWSFAPINVDMLWQADTYTPPFYKGKALYTPESEVTLYAMPNIIINGKRASPQDVVYKWYQDYELDNDASGFAKNTYQFKGPIILRQNIIEVDAYAATDEQVQGSNLVKLNFNYPQAITYLHSPLLGTLFNKAIPNEYTMQGQEVKFAVLPYYFSTQNKNLNVDYSWLLDNNKLELPAYNNSSIFRKTNSTKGSALINVLIGNTSHILQSANTAFTLNYE